MKDGSGDARPVPIPSSVRSLIRKMAPDRGDEMSEGRIFTVDGREWVARVAGHGLGGAGEVGGAFLVAIRFEPLESKGEADEVREALLPRGRLDYLFDEELVELFRRARKVER